VILTNRKDPLIYFTNAIILSLVIFSTAAVNSACSTNTSIQPARGNS
jgi:hypothetical protein